MLASTIRERLVQALSQKRSRLLRDKEQLDLADSNAFLLHPNQFSINDPASPGGQQNNRKTRHTRHRIDPEELSSAAVAQENKRKRKAAFEETEAGSPGPSIGGRPTTGNPTATNANAIANNANDTYAGSPYREARAKLAHTQFEAPLYSLERLFTEKELSMVMNNAHIAATHFFTKLQTRGDGNSNTDKNKDNNTDNNNIKTGDPALGAEDDGATQEVGAEPSGNADDMSATASGTLAATASADPMDQDIPDIAPGMDRAANASSMTTRGSTRNNNNNNTNGNNNHALNSLFNPANPANSSTMTALGNAVPIANNATIAGIPQTASTLLNPVSNNANANANANNDNNTTLFPPTIHHPVILPANIGSRANAAAPIPPALNQCDVDHDLALMARTGKSSEALNKQLLERACGPLIAREYAYRAPGVVAGAGAGGSSIVDDGLGVDGGLLAGAFMQGAASAGLLDGAGDAGDTGGLGGVPMSAQSSMGGMSEIGGVGIGIGIGANASAGAGVGAGVGAGGGGGVAMSRQSSARTLASGLGGVGMRRTASANASTGGGRGRNRAQL